MNSSPAPDGVADLLDGRGVERYWDVQDRLARGDAVDESLWRALFDTPAYRWQAPDDATRERIRGRMELAFQPSAAPLQAVRDQAEGYDVVRWEQHQRIRHEREALGRCYAELVASPVIADALAIAQEFLPASVVRSRPPTTPVQLLFFAPDAIAGRDAIYVDLLYACDQGPGFVRLLAHEFHHVYYASLSPFPDVPVEHPSYRVWHALHQLHLEGLADRIDKQRHPVAAEGRSPAYVEEYNRRYEDAPATLERFDAALLEWARAGDRAGAAQAAWDPFRLGAHAEGFFMANAIAEAQGAEALLEDIGDPFAFVRRFQSVRPVFSEASLEALAELEAQLLAEG